MTDNEEESPEDVAAAELALEIVAKAVPLIAQLAQLSEEKAANHLVMALITYATEELEGPFDEPLATEVQVIREITDH